MIDWRLKEAVSTMEKGGVVAYPTESVFGLGCDPWNGDAVLTILEIKQRDWTKGLILIAANFNQLQPFIKPVPNDVLVKLEQTWPGPVTWLLPASDDCPQYLKGLHDTIAVRVTAHKQAAKLCDAFGGAIVSTSANRTGHAPAKMAIQVKARLSNVDYVLSGACGGADKPSQIIDATTGNIIR